MYSERLIYNFVTSTFNSFIIALLEFIVMLILSLKSEDNSKALENMFVL